MWPDMRITILDYRRRVTRMRIASERLFMKLIKGSLAGLVLAGILKGEFERIRQAYQASGLRLVAARTEKEWRSGSFAWQ